MIKDTNLSEKLEHKIIKLLKVIDSVGPNPARQAMECGVGISGRVLVYFDQDRYESNEGYAEAWHKLNKEIIQITQVIRDRMIGISETNYDQT